MLVGGAERRVETSQIVEVLVLQRRANFLATIFESTNGLPRGRPLEVDDLPLGRRQLAHDQVHLLPYRVQSSLLWAIFHVATLALSLLLQLLHGLLDGVVDEEQGEEAILGLDDFEEVVLQGQ